MMITVDVTNLKVEELLEMDFRCECGKRHSVEINSVKIGSNIMEQLPEFLKEFKNKKILIVQDIHTYAVAGIRVEDILKNDFSLKKYVFPQEHLLPDVYALGRVLIEIEDDTALILAVGSGVINDICRYVAYRVHVPYAIVGTAPSMDGYASVVSPLITDGFKESHKAIYPYGIYSDIVIMKDAPMYLLCSGLGDVLGKYTALADWSIANLLTGEYYCKTIADMVQAAVDKCVAAAPMIPKRNDDVVKNITDALVLSGITIGMAGCSRPASGSEHHIAHGWEIMFHARSSEEKWVHGNFVGVGTVVMAMLFEALKDIDIENVIAKRSFRFYDMNKWRQNIESVFGKVAGNIINYKKDSIELDPDKRQVNAEKIASNWKEILNIGHTIVPSSENVKKVLQDGGCVWHPKELGIDKNLFIKTFIAAKDIRTRYGVVHLIDDLGLTEEFANLIANKLYRSNNI
ncbi:iron-containing alcohol dehydrogenase [Clostridium chromiireducens]|uniref:Iron-containing alcohol dehydrogenase n=2 Tax=Clostridium chromiireducens TaxID=225345 RepID=A0A964W4G5_9CLOT|nr:iron-containing alcohol dehydrogenase [Clostridium chromiireducens]